MNGSPWSWYQMVLALRFRGFRLFWMGKSLSYVAGGAYTVALTYLVWNITGQALPTAMVLTVQFLPTIVFGPWLGARVDQWDRRRAMICQQALSAVVSATMSALVLTDTAQLWSVYTLLFLSGTLTALSNPLQAALITEVLPKDDPAGRGQPRKSGGSLNSLSWQGGNLLGAGLAGLLIPVWGVGAVMALAPVAATVPIVLLARIRPQDRRPATTATRTARARILEGVRHVSADPHLMVALVLGAAVSMMAMGSLQAGAQLLVLSEYATTADEEARVLGWAGAAVAVGGISSQLLTGGGGYTPSGRLLVRVATALGVVIVVIAVAPALWGVLVLLAVASVCAYAHQTMAQLINLSAAGQLQGRIAGLWFALGSGGKALSGLLVGGLAQVFGARIGMVVCGVLLVVIAALTALLYRRARQPGTVAPSP